MSRIGSQVLCRVAQGGVGVVGRWRGKGGKMGERLQEVEIFNLRVVN